EIGLRFVISISPQANTLKKSWVCQVYNPPRNGLPESGQLALDDNLNPAKMACRRRGDPSEHSTRPRQADGAAAPDPGAPGAAHSRAAPDAGDEAAGHARVGPPARR